MLQAGITGLLGALVLVCGYQVWQVVTPWRLFFTAASLITLVAWLGVLKRWQVWIDADHGIHPPLVVPQVQTFEATPEMVRVGLVDDQGGYYLNGQYIDFPISRDQLVAVCLVLVAGAAFSHASLAGPKRPLSRAEYEALRDVFLVAGLVRWQNPRARNLGLILTGQGAALARHYAMVTPAREYHPTLRLIEGDDIGDF